MYWSNNIEQYTNQEAEKWEQKVKNSDAHCSVKKSTVET